MSDNATLVCGAFFVLLFYYGVWVAIERSEVRKQRTACVTEGKVTPEQCATLFPYPFDSAQR
jgi:hypothetical protein